MAPYPSGKGVVCKTIMHQFDSDRRLLIFFLGGKSMDDDGGSSRDSDDQCSGLCDSVDLPVLIS